jgi:transcriptional regulator with XRE-family HTH domain
MSFENRLGRRIQACREAKKISRSELAKLIGISPATIWHWETRGTIPRQARMSKIAEALQVSESYLWGTGAPEVFATSASISKQIGRLKTEIAILTGIDVSNIKVEVMLVG